MSRSKSRSPQKKEFIKLEIKLKAEIKKLLLENRKLKKIIKELQNKKPINKKEKSFITECPNCNSTIKNFDLPEGKLYLCSNACGYRKVKK